MVKHLAIDRKEYSLQRSGTDVYPKKEPSVHEIPRLTARELSGDLPV
jgi:hypothetical protein